MSVRNDDRVSSAKLKETLDKLWEDRYLGKEPTSHTVEVEHGEVTTDAQNFFNNFDAEIVANFWNNFRDLSNGTMIRLNKSSENTFEQSLLKLRITNDDETYYFKDVLLFRYDGDDAYSVLPTGKRHAALKFLDYGGTNSLVEIIIYPAYPESEYPHDVLRFVRETDEETEVISSWTYSVGRAVSEDEDGAIRTIIVESEAYTETVTIKDKHTIKQDFLPNADWNVNDPEADGYVEGRTHWVEKGTPKQFPAPGEYSYEDSREGIKPFLVSVEDLPDTIELMAILSPENNFTIGEYTEPLAELAKFEYEGFYLYTDPEWDGERRVDNYQYFIQCYPITSDSVFMYGADFNSLHVGLAVVNMAKSVVHKLPKKYYEYIDKKNIQKRIDMDYAGEYDYLGIGLGTGLNNKTLYLSATWKRTPDDVSSTKTFDGKEFQSIGLEQLVLDSNSSNTKSFAFMGLLNNANSLKGFAPLWSETILNFARKIYLSIADKAYVEFSLKGVKSSTGYFYLLDTEIQNTYGFDNYPTLELAVGDGALHIYDPEHLFDFTNGDVEIGGEFACRPYFSKFLYPFWNDTVKYSFKLQHSVIDATIHVYIEHAFARPRIKLTMSEMIYNLSSKQNNTFVFELSDRLEYANITCIPGYFELKESLKDVLYGTGLYKDSSGKVKQQIFKIVMLEDKIVLSAIDDDGEVIREYYNRTSTVVEFC